MSDALTNFPKPINEKLGYGATEDDVYAWFVKYEKTILKALSAYEKLQGVDLEELRDAVQILETWDTSRDGYIKPKYFPMRDVLNAARIVADINKEERN